ncbi:hypothetical protein [Bradyrhizobium sp. URHC0002]
MKDDITTIPDALTAYDFLEARTYITLHDEFVLLRMRTTRGSYWFRLTREEYVRFAAFLTSEAQLMNH